MSTNRHRNKIQLSIHDEENGNPLLQSKNDELVTLSNEKWIAIAQKGSENQVLKDLMRFLVVKGALFNKALEYDETNSLAASEKFIKQALFNNDEKAFQEHYPLLAKHWNQSVATTFFKAINKAIAHTNLKLSDNELITSANVVLDENGNICVDVVLTSLRLENKETKELAGYLPGAIASRFVLTEEGFKLDWVEPSNTLLKPLILEEKADLSNLATTLKQALVEEIENLEDTIHSLPENDNCLKSAVSILLKLKNKTKEIEVTGQSAQPWYAVLSLTRLILENPTNQLLEHKFANLIEQLEQTEDEVKICLPDLKQIKKAIEIQQCQKTLVELKRITSSISIADIQNIVHTITNSVDVNKIENTLLLTDLIRHITFLSQHPLDQKIFASFAQLINHIANEPDFDDLKPIFNKFKNDIENRQYHHARKSLETAIAEISQTSDDQFAVHLEKASNEILAFVADKQQTTTQLAELTLLLTSTARVITDHDFTLPKSLENAEFSPLIANLKKAATEYHFHHASKEYQALLEDDKFDSTASHEVLRTSQKVSPESKPHFTKLFRHSSNLFTKGFSPEVRSRYKHMLERLEVEQEKWGLENANPENFAILYYNNAYLHLEAFLKTKQTEDKSVLRAKKIISLIDIMRKDEKDINKIVTLSDILVHLIENDLATKGIHDIDSALNKQAFDYLAAMLNKLDNQSVLKNESKKFSAEAKKLCDTKDINTLDTVDIAERVIATANLITSDGDKSLADYRPHIWHMNTKTQTRLANMMLEVYYQKACDNLQKEMNLIANSNHELMAAAKIVLQDIENLKKMDDANLAELAELLMSIRWLIIETQHTKLETLTPITFYYSSLDSKSVLSQTLQTHLTNLNQVAQEEFAYQKAKEELEDYIDKNKNHFLAPSASNVLTEVEKVKHTKLPPEKGRVPLLTEALVQTKNVMRKPTNFSTLSNYFNLAERIGHHSWGKRVSSGLLLCLGMGLIFVSALTAIGTFGAGAPIGVLGTALGITMISMAAGGLLATGVGAGFFRKEIKERPVEKEMNAVIETARFSRS